MQKFDFGFEEEDTIDGMKKLIIEEVNSFRAEVRAQARAAGQIRRQERCVLIFCNMLTTHFASSSATAYLSRLGTRSSVLLCKSMDHTMELHRAIRLLFSNAVHRVP